MNREQAYQILTKYLTNQNLIKHCLATEAAMRGIYRYLSTKEKSSYAEATEDTWGIVGLLHDADYELAKGKPEVHGLLLFEKEPDSIPEDIAYAIKAHNYENTNVIPKTHMDWAIAACDQLTGLIVAATLVSPEKKLAAITPGFVLNRFNEKSFAKGADRNSIMLCESKLQIPLSEFIAIVLTAMKSISDSLGL